MKKGGKLDSERERERDNDWGEWSERETEGKKLNRDIRRDEWENWTDSKKGNRAKETMK